MASEPDDPYRPIASSSQKYSFHESECKIVDNLRAWSKEYFERFLVFETETRIPPPLSKREEVNPKFRDFDVQARVLSMEKLDDVYSEVILKDLGCQLYSMRVNTQKFPHLEKDNVHRFRSITPLYEEA